MFRKSIVGTLAAGVVIAAAVIVLKVVESKKESAEKETPEEDNEIHFIETAMHNTAKSHDSSVFRFSCLYALRSISSTDRSLSITRS